MIETNPDKGMELLTRAATEHASASAFYSLGEFLYDTEQENGVPEKKTEDETSIRLFKMAAELGDSDAMYFLGSAYHEGLPGYFEASAPTALAYFTQAAEKGHLQSAFHLSLMLLTGDGVDADTGKAKYYLRLAADRDHPEALFLLAEMHFNGSDGENLDYQQALKLFKRAAKLGHAGALYNLGVMYFNGYGTKVDHEKAFYSYQNASVFNHVGAVECLADMYDKGLGVPQRFVESIYFQGVAFSDSRVQRQERRILPAEGR